MPRSKNPLAAAARQIAALAGPGSRVSVQRSVRHVLNAAGKVVESYDIFEADSRRATGESIHCDSETLEQCIQTFAGLAAEWKANPSARAA